MALNFVVVHRTYDPIQAELLGDLMRDAGLDAQVLGTRSGAMIGAGQVIMQMYIQEIGSIPALPKGAALIVAPVRPVLIPSLGRKGARCSRTATGPTPGPPPPWGMQKVLCKFKWDTSPPNFPGLATPTRAFKFAPSI